MSECINYIGAVNRFGYGWRAFRGTQMHASRAAWIESNGEISKGLHVLHKCDNPRCVNLEHLYLGTHSQNMLDRAKRGRCKTYKLTQEKADEIRKIYNAGGITQTAISIKYSLSTGYVSELVRGKYWNQ